MPPKKEIPVEGSKEDVELSESDSVTIHICEFCNRNPCKCRFLICPFHGKVNAIPCSDGFTCKVDDCQIIRKENELEP